MLKRGLLSLCFAMCLSGIALAQNPVTDIKPQAYLETSMGAITLELNQTQAPVTVANMLRYIDEQFYDGLIFHRVMNNFMIQGGGFDPNLTQKTPHAAIINESSNGLSNLRGTIAMARTDDPCSATSQFYINQVDNAYLDKANASDGYGYCVFGEVLHGLAVVDAIAAVPTSTQNSMQNVPVTPVLIERFRRMVASTYIAEPAEEIDGLAGESVSLALTIENVTDDDANTPMTVGLYWGDSETDTFDDPCQWLTQENFTTIPAQGTTTLHFTFNAPATPGDYAIFPFLYETGQDASELDITSQLLGGIPFTVAPTGPDLIIADPCAASLTYEPGAAVTFPVKVSNIGGIDAIANGDPNDPNDPNAVFWITVYRSDDPCWSDPCYWQDPCVTNPLGDAALAAEFSLTSLAAGTSESRNLTFTAPQQIGAYYLTALADDTDTVLEYNETNNFGTVVQLNVAYDPCDVNVSKCTVKLGKSSDQANVTLKGEFLWTPNTAAMDEAASVSVKLGTYQETIPRTAFKKSGEIYRYQSSSKTAISSIILDFSKARFTIKARGIDLTGTTAPMAFELAFADYRGVDSITETVINGKGYLPLAFNQGLADMLQVENWRITSDSPRNYNNDTLVIKGLISTQVAAPVLAGKQMTVKWGTSTVRTYVIPAMQPQKNSLVFKYSGLEKTSDKRINATFDFEKGVFMIRIAKAYMVSVPTSTTSQNLVLQFAADSTHNFDKTVAVFAH